MNLTYRIENSIQPYDPSLASHMAVLTTMSQKGVEMGNDEAFISKALEVQRGREKLAKPDFLLPRWKRIGYRILEILPGYNVNRTQIQHIIARAAAQYELSRKMYDDVVNYAALVMEAHNRVIVFDNNLCEGLKAMEVFEQKAPECIKDLQSRIEALETDSARPDLHEHFSGIMPSEVVDLKIKDSYKQVRKMQEDIAKLRHDLGLVSSYRPVYEGMHERVSQQLERWDDTIAALNHDMGIIGSLMFEFRNLTAPQIVITQAQQKVAQLADIASQLSNSMFQVQAVTEIGPYRDDYHVRQIQTDMKARTAISRELSDQNLLGGSNE